MKLVLCARKFLDLIFPRSCVGCGVNAGDICGSCFNQIQMIEASKVSTDIEYLDELIVSAKYRNSPVLRKLIWLNKYKYSLETSEILSKVVKRRFAEFSHRSEYLICAVPLAVKKHKQRGFNQAALLAERLARDFSHLELCNCLKKIRETEQQAKLNAKQRRANVFGAFEVERDASSLVQGREIVVVDDVVSTGSTFSECAKVLKSAGAVKVIGLVLARGGWF